VVHEPSLAKFVTIDHIGIHGNEMADKRAADKCSMGKHFDYDLSIDYTRPFRDKF